MTEAYIPKPDELTDYLPLQEQLNLREGLPYTPNWSAAADFLQLIVDHCLQTKPSQVFECSCGLTTLMLARCCQMNGQGHLLSLENGEEFAANISRHLRRYGLDRYASVIHAPLRKTLLDGVEYNWYDTQTVPKGIIEMLVIDGPPGFIQKNSRYPALPLLYPKLADGSRVFLDDAARPDEREIVAQWQSRFPDLEVEYIDNSRGCTVLTVHK